MARPTSPTPRTPWQFAGGFTPQHDEPHRILMDAKGMHLAYIETAPGLGDEAAPMLCKLRAAPALLEALQLVRANLSNPQGNDLWPHWKVMEAVNAAIESAAVKE